MRWFCPNCETQGRCISINRFKYKTQCENCRLACRIEIIVSPEKTWEEVDEVFQQIPLTKFQKFG